MDRNKVTDLDLDLIAPRLWVGPSPHRPQDLDSLARAGVTAVLNLQTDQDLQRRGVELDRLGEELGRRGIELHRVPIRDFDEPDLIRRLPEATATLDRLLKAGHSTYVHCTAGIGRAPAVILVYLVRQGRALHHARELLYRRRPASSPNLVAVRRVLEDVPSIRDHRP